MLKYLSRGGRLAVLLLIVAGCGESTLPATTVSQAPPTAPASPAAPTTPPTAAA
nr:hypothetical protein [Herpetosiphonaceae bacterium]